VGGICEWTGMFLGEKSEVLCWCTNLNKIVSIFVGVRITVKLCSVYKHNIPGDIASLNFLDIVVSFSGLQNFYGI
jgi:hypothetical protein